MKKQRSLLPVILVLAGVVVALGVTIGAVLVHQLRQIQSKPSAQIIMESDAPSLVPAETGGTETAAQVDDNAVTLELSESEQTNAEQCLRALFSQGMSYAEAEDFEGFSSLCIGQDTDINRVYGIFLDRIEDQNKYIYSNTEFFILGKMGDTYVGYVYSYVAYNDNIHKVNTPLCFIETLGGCRINSGADFVPVLMASLPAQAAAAREQGRYFDWFNLGLTHEFRWATNYVENSERNYTFYFIWRNEDGSASMLIHLNNGWSQNASFGGTLSFGEPSEDGKSIKTLYGQCGYVCVIAANSSSNVVVTIPADQLTEAGKGAWTSSILIIDFFSFS